MVRAESKRRTIVRNPRILFGEPTIEGTRISVRTVVLLNYACGGDVQWVQRELPTLTVADIEIALRYYPEHRDEINTYIAANVEGEEIPYERL